MNIIELLSFFFLPRYNDLRGVGNWLVLTYVFPACVLIYTISKTIVLTVKYRKKVIPICVCNILLYICSLIPIIFNHISFMDGVFLLSYWLYYSLFILMVVLNSSFKSNDFIGSLKERVLLFSLVGLNIIWFTISAILICWYNLNCVYGYEKYTNLFVGGMSLYTYNVILLLINIFAIIGRKMFRFLREIKEILSHKNTW